MRIRILAAAMLAVCACALPQAARADDLVALVSRPSLINSHSGRIAWSSYDPVQSAYVLMTRFAGVTSTVPVAPRPVPFDVDLGPDQNGDTVAAYSRCRREPTGRVPATGNVITRLPVWETGRGCDLYRFTFATGRETTIAVANSPSASEFLPSIWKARVAFARVYERKHGVAGDRAYLYARGIAGPARSVRVPAGSRSRQQFCSGKPRRCKRLLEPGPTAIDLGGRRLAFGWDSGGEIGPTTAAYFATLGARPRKRRVELGSSGSIQAEEIVQPAVDTGQIYWGMTLFGDTTSNSLRRYRIATGDYQQAKLPPPSVLPDAFLRPVLGIAVDGTVVYYLESGRTLPGEPCTPQQPCVAEPGCTDTEPCRLMLTQSLPFERYTPPRGRL